MKTITKIILLFTLTIISSAYIYNLGVRDYGLWLGLTIGFSYLIGNIEE